MPIGVGRKKKDVEQRDKSHVGPQGKKNICISNPNVRLHVIDLTKMVKRIMGPQEAKKSHRKKNQD